VGIDSPFPPLARVTEHRHVQDETPPDIPPEGRFRRDFADFTGSPAALHANLLHAFDAGAAYGRESKG